MEPLNLRDYYNGDYREFIVGEAVTGHHNIYLAYGEASAGERREMGSEGHEEILLVLAGEVLMENGKVRVRLEREQTVYLPADESWSLTALADSRYVVAGGHAAVQHGG